MSFLQLILPVLKFLTPSQRMPTLNDLFDSSGMSGQKKESPPMLISIISPISVVASNIRMESVTLKRLYFLFSMTCCLSVGLVVTSCPIKIFINSSLSRNEIFSPLSGFSTIEKEFIFFHPNPFDNTYV